MDPKSDPFDLKMKRIDVSKKETPLNKNICNIHSLFFSLFYFMLFCFIFMCLMCVCVCMYGNGDETSLLFEE
jgi:hypothetical protein